MSAPINQIQSPDDEDEDQTEEPLHDCKNENSAIKELVQESFLSYYNRDLGETQDFACYGAVSTASKISFELPSPKLKAKKRKADVVDGGGGRVVRATGRKDRHSKVRTARGPRDRRVRLSPRTAIQFYDVQDRLGYDRPSKAIDWLINEAKTAIDALEEQPSIKFSDLNLAATLSPSIANHGGFSLSQRGMRERQEHLHLNDDGLVSGFSCFVDEAPYPAVLEAYVDQDFSSSRNRSEIIYPSSQHEFCSTTQISETNWDMARLQKMFTWNSVNESSGSGGGVAEYSSGNSPPLHAAAQPISGGHVNFLSQREPLQSSVITSSPMSYDFSEFNFSNELSKISGAATMKQDENLKMLVFSMPSNTAHYQG